MQKIALLIMALVIVGAFVAGMVVQKATGPAPADIVIVAVNETGGYVWSDIQPLTPESQIQFSTATGATEYHLTYGH